MTIIHTISSATQNDGDQDFTLENIALKTAQVSFNTDDATSGNLAVMVKYHESTSWETLLDAAGNARTIDLSAPLSFKSDEWTSIRFTPTNVVGNYSVFIYEVTA